MIRPCDAVIAQLAEQLPCKHQVSSSSLDSGSLLNILSTREVMYEKAVSVDL